MNTINHRFLLILHLLALISITGCATNQQQQADKPQISEQPIERSVLITPPSEPQLYDQPEVVDQLKIVGEFYDVAIDDIINVDDTSSETASLGRKSGYLDVKISVYNIKDTELTPRLESAIFLATYRVCDEITSDSKSYINSLVPGYRVHLWLDSGHSIRGVLSEDKRTYLGSCKVSYRLKS